MIRRKLAGYRSNWGTILGHKGNNIAASVLEKWGGRIANVWSNFKPAAARPTVSSPPAPAKMYRSATLPNDQPARKYTWTAKIQHISKQKEITPFRVECVPMSHIRAPISSTAACSFRTRCSILPKRPSLSLPSKRSAKETLENAHDRLHNRISS